MGEGGGGGFGESRGKLEFRGINFEEYTSQEDGTVFDAVLVQLTNAGSGELHFSPTEYRVDKQENGEWYTVYHPYLERFLNSPCLEPEHTHLFSFLVPAGLFEEPGAYRLYMEQVGYCEIDILFRPNG